MQREFGNVLCDTIPHGEPVRQGNMTDLAKENSIVSHEVLCLASAIKGQLFGRGSEDACGKDEPSCFVDELLKTNAKLKAAAGLLREIVDKIGA